VSVAKAETRKATHLLVISRGAGSMNAEVEAKLRKAFADHTIVDFNPNEKFEDLVTPQARIVVAGGDGTVEFLVRKFADSQHPIGILALGTFNNLARALGLPTDVDKAIELARDGHARAITLGRVNGRIFVEACAIGLFGQTIALGDSAKDMEFGKLAYKLKDVISAKRFGYELAGDIEGSGSAMSLVFSNTATIGSQLPISEGSPIDPNLEFTVHAGRTRFDIVARALKSAILPKQDEDAEAQVFRFRKLEVKTRPRVRVYADNQLVGRTPATIAAETSALKVLLPG
jgi:diacylglycerol kinase (ATP)